MLHHPTGRQIVPKTPESRQATGESLTGSDEWTSIESRYDPIDLSATQVTGVVAVSSSKKKICRTAHPQCVRLHEKGGTVRHQPVSLTLLTALAEHAAARGARKPTDPVLATATVPH
jgi:hypothetical protein